MTGSLSGWTVGRTIHLGSEDPTWRLGRLGHKGQVGSNPGFPDDANHVGTCTAVDLDNTVHMRCTCGLEWTFRQDD